MAQATPTTCAHNAPGQVILADRPTSCRKCGAQIQATPRAKDANTGLLVPSSQDVNAVYPGDGRSASSSWALSQ